MLYNHPCDAMVALCIGKNTARIFKKYLFGEKYEIQTKNCVQKLSWRLVINILCIWGGKVIQEPYHSKALKKGFKFNCIVFENRFIFITFLIANKKSYFFQAF